MPTNADENALYRRRRKRKWKNNQSTRHDLSVKPVLRTVLHRKTALNPTAVLRRHTTRSVYPVNLVVRPRRLALSRNRSIQLEPRNTTQTIRSLGRSRGRSTLGINSTLHTTEVVLVRLEHEERDARGGELMVTRETLVCLCGRGDRVVECEVGDLAEDVHVEAGGVAGGVEERGDGASGFGDGGCGGVGARVVLGAPADGDVPEGCAGCGGGEGGRCWGVLVYVFLGMLGGGDGVTYQQEEQRWKDHIVSLSSTAPCR